MKKRAAELLADQKAELVLAWAAGDMFYDNAPAYFSTAEELNNLVFNDFCGSNLSKYLLANSKKDEKTAQKKRPQRFPADKWKNAWFAAKNRRYLQTEQHKAICNLIRVPRGVR